MTGRFFAFGIALALLSTAALAAGPQLERADAELLGETVLRVREAGSAMLWWYVTRFDSSGEIEARSRVDLDDIPVISAEELAGLLVPDYLDELPVSDGWGRPLEFRLAREPRRDHWLAVRSAGADGGFSALEVQSGPAPPTDSGADVVWVDGYLAHWPWDPGAPVPESAHFDSADACEIAERIARQKPCVDPEECGAYRSWQRLFGMPKLEMLEPEYSGASAALLGGRPRSGRSDSLPPAGRAFVCPAD